MILKCHRPLVCVCRIHFVSLPYFIQFLSVFEDQTGGHFFSHSIPCHLIEHFAISEALKVRIIVSRMRLDFCSPKVDNYPPLVEKDFEQSRCFR